MRRQRNILQAKEQDKNPKDQINEEVIGKLTEKEFRVMLVKIQNLGNRIEKIQEIFNKDLEELMSKQTVMNNKITEIRNILEGYNSRITEAEEWISELEERTVEISATEQDKENRMQRIEDSIRELWDIKQTNIRIIGVPEEEEKNGLRKYLKRLELKTSPTWESK